MTPTIGRVNAVWQGTVGVATTAPTGLLSLGFGCFCFYVFAYYGRVLDWLAPQLHMPAIAFVIAIFVAAVSGRFVEVFRHPIAVCMAGLTVCLGISVPFAYWREGSLAVFAWSWLPSFALFSVGACVTVTLAQCRRSLLAVGLATGMAAVLVNVVGGISEERLSLQGTRFENANTIAITLLLGMPLVWLLAIRSRAGIFVKAFVGAVLLVMITAILRSGSREGLVGLAILGVLCFLHSSMAGKVGLAVAAVALAVGAAVLMPGSLKSRFATTFQGGPTEMEEYRGVLEREVMLSAAASTQIRSEMLMSSLKLTIQHPLLGIGPGDFAAYLADEAKSRNALAYWVGAHNTYTQLSSEAGIPALCLYLGTLISSLRALSRVSRRGRRIPDDRARDICTAAQALSASFVVYCVCGLFNHMAYEPTMPLMAGIALAISRAAPEELGRLEAAIAGQRGVRISLAAVSPVPTGPSRKRLAMRKRYGGAREELAAGPAWRIHGSE